MEPAALSVLFVIHGCVEGVLCISVVSYTASLSHKDMISIYRDTNGAQL